MKNTMKNTMKSTLMILIFLLLSHTAFAVCNAASPGTIRNISSAPHFCTAGGWIAMGDGLINAPCTAPEAGKIQLAGNQMNYCDGTDWIDVRSTKMTPCTEDGKIKYDALDGVVVCAENFWWGTATTAGSLFFCSSFGTQGPCDAQLGCHWDAGSCQDCYCERP